MRQSKEDHVTWNSLALHPFMISLFLLKVLTRKEICASTLASEQVRHLYFRSTLTFCKNVQVGCMMLIALRVVKLQLRLS